MNNLLPKNKNAYFLDYNVDDEFELKGLQTLYNRWFEGLSCFRDV